MVYRRVQKILINSVKRSFKLVKFWIFITLFLTSLFYFETTFWEIYSTPVDVLPVQVLIFSNPNDDKQSTSFSQQELETCSLPYSILPTNDITEKPTIALDALYKRFNSWHSKGDWNIPLIIFADGRDVLFNPYTTKQFITQFNALDSSIVLSAEPNCAPPEFCRNKPFGFERYQNIVGSDFYVNSGLIGGNIVSLLYAYLWMQEFTDEYKDDQSKLHEFFLHHRNSNKIYNLKSKYWTKHMADLMEANEKSHLVLMDTAFVLFDTLARHTFYYAPLNASSDTYSVNNFKKPGCNATGKARWNHRGVSQCNIDIHNCIRRDTDCSELYQITGTELPKGGRNVCTIQRSGKETQGKAPWIPFALHGNGFSGGRKLLKSINKELIKRNCVSK